MGKFNLGSTIVMLVEADKNFVWKVKEEDSIRFG